MAASCSAPRRFMRFGLVDAIASANPNRALEKSLGAAQARLEKAADALAPKHKGGEWEEFKAAMSDLMTAERDLAAARGQPHAVPMEFPVRWSTGAPLPYLLQNDYRAFLVFFVQDADPNWDGSYTTIRHASSVDASNLAVVEFKGCVSASCLCAGFLEEPLTLLFRLP
jgi:hypothetical protein